MHDDILRVDISHVDGTTVVTVAGEIDMHSALALRAPLDELSLEGRVLVDMVAVKFMDSTGLNVILSQSILMSESGGGSIYICNPSPSVRRLLEMAGLSEELIQPDTFAPQRAKIPTG